MSLADVIERLVLIAENLVEADAPVVVRGKVAGNDLRVCLACGVEVSSFAHDVDCSWSLAQNVAASDLIELRRLARVLRYTRND